MPRKKIKVNKNLILALKNIEVLDFEDFNELSGLSYPHWRRLLNKEASPKWEEAVKIAKDAKLSMEQKVEKVSKLFAPKYRPQKKGRGRKRYILEPAKAYLALKKSAEGKSWQYIKELIGFEGHWKTLETIIVEKRYDKETVAKYFTGELRIKF